MILFFFLVIYTYNRSATTLLFVRQTVVILFVVQYWIEVANISEYNSPKEFPQHLVGNDQTYTVYPNPTHYYYDVPIFLSYNTTRSDDGTLNTTNDLSTASYFCMDTDKRKLNGIWIDFVMTVTVALYFSLCNFWMIFRPVKVTMSEETKQKLRQYQQIIYQ